MTNSKLNASIGALMGLTFISMFPAVAQIQSTGTADRSLSYTWQQSQARVVANGPVDLVWQPQPFRFQAGRAVRYIDFENGSDTNDGKTAAKPWKHHPWDAAAPPAIRGQAGIDTTIFKRGVTYRGTLTAGGSGSVSVPIRLTSDPKWGTEQAVISGAERVTGRWQAVTDTAQHGLPPVASGRVWATRLPAGTQPMLLWVAGAGSALRRLPIAREPNWRVSDPYRLGSEWWRWQKTAIDYPRLTASDAEHLREKDPDAYVGATVWSDPPIAEFSWNAPEPSVVKAYDPAAGTLTFTVNHGSKYPKTGSRYYLENLPRFLDEAGEWLYRTEGPNARMLYLWAPDGKDPNTMAVEVARRWVILDIAGQSNIAVSGLTFRGGNAPDPSFFNSRREGFNVDKPWLTEDIGAIRLRGQVRGVTVANCRIEKTAVGITYAPIADGDVLDHVRIQDSTFDEIDEAAITLTPGTVWRNAPLARIRHVNVLRNRIREVGQRVIAGSTQGINIEGAEVIEVAGNIVHRTGGQGINVVTGRALGGIESQNAKHQVVPLTRTLVHHNKASETLLQIQDFGGIEGWGSGPAYFYNNISANPVGWIRHNDWYHKNEAFYFDHQWKGYFFNNIGWTDPRADAWENTLSSSFFNQANGNRNTVFHNTGYRFRAMFYKMADKKTNNRELFLGNLGIAATSSFIGAGGLEGNSTVGYAHNLVVGAPTNYFSYFQGLQVKTPAEFQSYLDKQKALVSNVGGKVDSAVVVDAKNHDFRPLPGSPADNRGVRVYVPWGLSTVTGEWHFRVHRADPTVVVGENMYLTREEAAMGNGPETRNDLRVAGAKESDYEVGVLEDWVNGALKLDGSRFCVQEKAEQRLQVADLDMTNNSFLIQTFLRVDKETGDGVIAGKLAESAGYALRVRNGRISLLLRSGGSDSEVIGAAINDGIWHHVVAEADRKSGVLHLYIDGKLRAKSKSPLAAGASLANDAEFIAGKGVIGAIDFLRVSRGSLADAETTIGELYAWEFAGPQTKDFSGKPIPPGARRTIGALEPRMVGSSKNEISNRNSASGGR
jgi:hypothetical protein